MPSPFPGMGPYLEGDLWTSVHTDLSVEIARQLAPQVRPNYAVRTQTRGVNAGLGDPIPHVSVEIRDRKDRRLVTCIEVLTPTNKVGPTREEYVGKRSRVLSTEAHLLEVDLIREGARIPTPSSLPAAPYFVFLTGPRREHVAVWPIHLVAPLPTVPVPLLSGDADVQLDLQLALTTICDILD